MKAKKFEETILMKNEIRQNFRIVGDNSSGGGYFNNARIMGNSIINGDIDCINFKSVGDSKIEGNLKAKRIKILGSALISGSVKSGSAAITGDLKTSGDIQSETLVLRGGIDTGGGIKSEDVKLKGYITINKNCETEIFKSDGILTINGLLNAEEITIKTYGTCEVSEIGGEKITIGRGFNSSITKMIKFLFMPSDFHKGTLVTDSIEGNEIHVSNTKAKVIRGKNVTIGDGCEIDLVEYEDKFSTHGKSTVREKRKIQ